MVVVAGMVLLFLIHVGIEHRTLENRSASQAAVDRQVGLFANLLAAPCTAAIVDAVQ